MASPNDNATTSQWTCWMCEETTSHTSMLCCSHVIVLLTRLPAHAAVHVLANRLMHNVSCDKDWNPRACVEKEMHEKFSEISSCSPPPSRPLFIAVFFFLSDFLLFSVVLDSSWLPYGRDIVIFVFISVFLPLLLFFCLCFAVFLCLRTIGKSCYR